MQILLNSQKTEIHFLTNEFSERIDVNGCGEWKKKRTNTRGEIITR